jgi:hypothetical protein
MPDRLELRLDIKITGAIDTAGRRIGVLDRGDGHMRRRRQIGLTILRSQIMAPLLAPSGTGTLCAKLPGRRHRPTR